MEPPRPTIDAGLALPRVKDSPNESAGISTTAAPGTISQRRHDSRLSQPNDSPVGKPATTHGRSRILVVEDNADLRRMLATVLELEGYDVDEAADAREGLARLAAARYDLVLTDYAMPGETGTWMLHEAARLGLMHDAVALIVTAQPGVREISEIEVIAKPLDIDRFLEQVRRILSSSAARPDPVTEPANTHKVELVLYVSSVSATSIQARDNLQHLLEEFDGSQIKFTVCDLAEQPLGGNDDRVTFTPTLVKRYPAPRMWILGNLRSPRIVADLLRACGIEDRESTH